MKTTDDEIAERVAIEYKMSAQIDNGGPAFPTKRDYQHGGGTGTENIEGMSLRDYFAGKALQMIVMNDVSGRPENFRQHYSEGAYKWADAMLEARKQFLNP